MYRELRERTERQQRRRLQVIERCVQRQSERRLRSVRRSTWEREVNGARRECVVTRYLCPGEAPMASGIVLRIMGSFVVLSIKRGE